LGRAVSCKPRRITWLRRIGSLFGALQVGADPAVAAAPAENVAAGQLGGVSGRKLLEETVSERPRYFIAWHQMVPSSGKDRFVVLVKNLFL
jgi:hypothetical protein